MTERPLVSPNDAAARILRRVRLQPDRAVFVLAEVPWSQQVAFDSAVTAALGQLELEPEAVRRLELSPDPGSQAQLRRLNMDRDLLRHGLRLLLMVVRDQSGLGWARTQAPDLAAMTDNILRIEPVVTEEDWPTLAQQLQAWGVERNRWIDLSALSPKVGDRVLLSPLYLSLIRITWTSMVKLRTNLKGQSRPLLSLFLAPPGSGKSTYLRQSAAKQSPGDGRPVRLLVPLPAYGDYCASQGSLSVLDFVPRYLSSEGIPAGRHLTANLSHVSLMLDGLDELADVGLRTSLLREVADAVDSGRLHSCMVAGRPSVVSSLPANLVSRFGRVSALPLRREDLAMYVDTWSRIRSWPLGRASRLKELIDTDPALSELATRPFHLMLLTLAFERLDELPRHRVQLYEAVNAVLVARWRRARSMVSGGPALVEPYKVLGPLAHRILGAGGLVHKQTLRTWLVELEGRFSPTPTATACADRLISLLQTDAAVLGPWSGSYWAFAHPTLGEHLVARGVLQDAAAWESLLRDPFAAGLREVVLFAAATLALPGGERERLRTLFERVLARSKRRGQYSLQYASLLAGLLREQLPAASDFVERILVRLWALWLDAKYFVDVATMVYAEAAELLRWAAKTALREPIIVGLRVHLDEARCAAWWARSFRGIARRASTFSAASVSATGWYDFVVTLRDFAVEAGLRHDALARGIASEELSLHEARSGPSQALMTGPSIDGPEDLPGGGLDLD